MSEEENAIMAERGETGKAIGGQVGEKAGGQAGAAVGGYFGGPLGAAIGQYVGEKVGKEIGEKVGDKAEEELKDLVSGDKKSGGGGCSGGSASGDQSSDSVPGTSPSSLGDVNIEDLDMSTNQMCKKTYTVFRAIPKTYPWPQAQRDNVSDQFTPQDGSMIGMKAVGGYYGDDYYDTDGNATLIKSERIVYNSEEMQFIAVTTKDGHVFYVLINYSAENAEDQVFFLNKVDDYDLYALLYAGAEDNDEKKKITPEQAAQAAEKANGRVQSGDGADTADTEETAEDGEDATDSAAQAKPVPMNKNSMMLVFGAIALIGVGGAGFFIMKKKNGGGNSKSAMQDEPEYDDDNEITEDEDDMKFYDDQDDEI